MFPCPFVHFYFSIADKLGIYFVFSIFPPFHFLKINWMIIY